MSELVTVSLEDRLDYTPNNSLYLYLIFTDTWAHVSIVWPIHEDDDM